GPELSHQAILAAAAHPSPRPDDERWPIGLQCSTRLARPEAASPPTMGYGARSRGWAEGWRRDGAVRWRVDRLGGGARARLPPPGDRGGAPWRAPDRPLSGADARARGHRHCRVWAHRRGVQPDAL